MSKKILLADDSVTIQKVIELTFMDEDYDVTAVSNGDEALQRLEEMTPDIVIADVHMPGATGLEVCRQAKAQQATVPVLLLVGTFEAFDEAEAEEAGADAHLKKPFDSQELLHVVGKLLADADTDAPTDAAADTDGGAEDDNTPPEAAADSVAEVSIEVSGDGDGDADTAADEGVFGQVEEPAPVAAAQEEVAASDEGRAAGDVFELPAEATAPAADWGFESEAQPFALGGEEAPQALWESSGENQVEPPADLDSGSAEATAEASPADHEATRDEPEAPVEAPPFGAEMATRQLSSQDSDVAAGEGDEEAPADAAAAGAAGGLSDADVDRIARRVAELVGDRLAREVAWEVIPDLAEVVIKDRLRELEAQLD